jgi:integrase
MTDRDGSAYLVPNLGVKEDSPYSSNHLCTLRKELAEVAGVEFRPKDFRSTFASLTVKKDPALLVHVSRQLGHGSLDITQRFYASIEASDAGDRLCKAWTEEAKPASEISKK